MSSIVVGFKEEQNTILVKQKETLLAALRRAGYSIPAACGGKGRCGKCRVTVNGILRLACKTIPKDGDVVLLPEHSGGRILTETLPLKLDTSAARQSGYVAAIDLGTTTIALRLFDNVSGGEKYTVTEWNKQAAYGADVISRMEYILQAMTNLQELSGVIRTQIASMLDTALQAIGVSKSGLLHITLAGNTVMQHIFAGYPIDGIATAPFQPHSLFIEEKAELDGTSLTYAPCISGYVGGDVTAGILAADLQHKDGHYLFLDIGTNGEMALGGKDGFLCCAVASGPAFEGAGISCGLPGVNGAISHVRYDNGFLYDVIGTEQAKGFCGSGLIDLAAELLRLGIIDEGGRLLPPEEAPPHLQRYLEKDAEGNGLFRFNKQVYLTARDVRNLQLAKAAVAGGIEVLLQHAKLTLDEVDGLYLAGGFGNYINAANAQAIGLLPQLPIEKLHVVGNTSLAGASLMALNSKDEINVNNLAEQMHYIELSGRSDFAAAFTNNMKF